jgi:hypothetical protein
VKVIDFARILHSPTARIPLHPHLPVRKTEPSLIAFTSVGWVLLPGNDGSRLEIRPVKL